MEEGRATLDWTVIEELVAVVSEVGVAFELEALAEGQYQ
jgi:hypothetical protein